MRAVVAKVLSGFGGRVGAMFTGLFYCVISSTGALAGSSWDEIRPLVFEDRIVHPAGAFVRLEAPMRPHDQSGVPVKMEAQFDDGRTVRKVTFIVDENPTPVSAVFEMGAQRSHVKLGTLFRLNAATDVRVVVEASDGKLYMAERHVKFAGGQAACSAPPTGDPVVIAATMGRMTFASAVTRGDASPMRPSGIVKINHPNHTGMALDQLTLLYVPLKIVSDIEVRQGDELVFKMAGSMTLSQDPEIEFDYRTNGATQISVTVADSDGAVWQKQFPLGPGS